MEPYKFKKILFNDGILNKSVDATYIIHLEGNGRYEHIQKQLLEYHPTNIVYILFNKGYKKSIKKPFIDKPPLDLVDAFLEVFKHANKKKYNNILILEDDFIFSEKIKSSIHVNNINQIINKLDNQDFIYLLGCIPPLLIPYDMYNYRVYKSLGAHSMIYSKKNRIKTLNIDQQYIDDWEIYNYNNKRLTYYIPICYQLFPYTDNSNYWGGRGHNNIINKNLHKFLQYILIIFNLDKKVEPGTSFFYFIAKFLFWMIIFTIIFLLYKIKF